MTASYSPQIVQSALTDPSRVCTDMGGDAAGIGQTLGITDRARTDTIALQKYVQFFEVSARTLRRPDFGWTVGAEFDLRNLGDFGPFILEAPTLGAALSLFRKSFAMIQSDSEMDLTIDGDAAVLSYRILDLDIWPRQQDAELTLSVFHQLIKSIAGPGWRPSALTFEHGTSAVWRNARTGPHCTILCDAPTNSLRFPARLLDLPMGDAPSQPVGALSQAITREAWARERDAPVAIRVRREVVRRLGRDSLDQTQIANAIGYSRRTLRRRLEAENASFSAILSDCRTRYAEIALHLSNRPLSEISEHLGYSSVSAFERAFKLCTGMTPARYRKQSRAPGTDATCSEACA